MLVICHILHPTDFSERSAEALQLAQALAKDHGARLTVLHVVPTGTTDVLGLLDLGSQTENENIQRSLWDQLHRLAALDGDLAVDYRLEEGDPAAMILAVAEDIDADLVVMGTYGRTGFSRWVMGSVAEQVVRQADCPVLTVKKPLPRKTPATSAACGDAMCVAEKAAERISSRR